MIYDLYVYYTHTRTYTGEMNAYVAALTNVSVCTKPLKLDYFVACVACFPAGETIAWSVLRSTLCEITSARYVAIND